MKIRFTLVILLIAGMTTSAFACGMSGGGGSQSPGRQKWTKKRVNELKHQKKHDGPGLGTRAISKWQQLNNPLAYTDEDAYKAAVKKQRLVNTIEFLALKKERGELSPEGKAKLNALINYYRTNYMSGY
jgi:hypothetical protein